jgi:TetR/AcrR family transcriptional regulator, cholesterol catabolism regulator
MTKTADGGVGSDEVLFHAAGTLFRQKGYAATTLREIAAAAGMLPGSLHYRFASKETLLLKLMERGIARAIAAVRVAIADRPDPIARVRSALEAHLGLLVREDEAIYVLLYEWRVLVGPSRARMVRLRDSYDALWDGLLHRAAGTGQLRPDVDLRLTRLFLLGSANWVAQWYSPRGERSPEAIAQALADTLLEGILVRGAESRVRPVDAGDAAILPLLMPKLGA